MSENSKDPPPAPAEPERSSGTSGLMTPPHPAFPPATSKAFAFRGVFAIRQTAPTWQMVVSSLLCLAVCYGLWWYVTRGPYDQRILPYSVLPSPAETFASFHSLWFD